MSISHRTTDMISITLAIANTKHVIHPTTAPHVGTSITAHFNPPFPPPKRVDSDRHILVRSMASSTALCGPVTASLHPSATHAVSHSFAGRRLRLGCSASPARGCRRAVPAGDRHGAPSLGRIVVRCAGIETIVESEFEAEVLGAEVPVLVEFFAEWCGPCRLVTPFVEWASQEYKGRLKVVKIDHDANPQLIKEYKVYGLPALILFMNGKEVPGSRKEGAITKVKLKEYLDSLLDSTPVA